MRVKHYFIFTNPVPGHAHCYFFHSPIFISINLLNSLVLHKIYFLPFMSAKKEDIIRQLQKDILQMQGFKRVTARDTIRINLGPIDTAFPNGSFPLSAVHEFINKDIACTAATNGFISFLISSLMEKGDACVWISSSGTVFLPALKSFGVEPDKIIFINVHKEKEILWVMEEALKCEGLAAVVGEIKEIGFTESRRLQLAVEKSHVTGFIIRNDPRNMHVNACVS